MAQTWIHFYWEQPVIPYCFPTLPAAVFQLNFSNGFSSCGQESMMFPACDSRPAALIIEHMQRLNLMEQEPQKNKVCVCLGTPGLTPATSFLWSGEKVS